MNPPPLNSRRLIWPLFKWAFFLVVLAFVVQSGVHLWKLAPPASVRIEWIWLVPAGVFYFIGWIPSFWLWRALLLALHQPTDYWNVFRAYYVGHIGKYSPGKGLVPVIRTALLKDHNTSSVLIFIAVAYETLLFMASGAILGLAVAPFAVEEAQWSKIPVRLAWIRDDRLMFSLSVIAAGLASAPITSWLFTRIGRGVITKRHAIQTELPSISVGLIATGIAVCAAGWICHAISIGLVITSITHVEFDITRLPLWIVAGTVSTVGGFIAVFAPGGLGVREGLLIEVLKDSQDIGPAYAIIVACLLRLVWFASESIAAGVLYVAGRRRPSSSGSHD